MNISIKNISYKIIFIALATFISYPLQAKSSIQWKDFLQKQDLVWNGTLPNDWTNGSFMGNGLLGTVIYTVPDSNSVRFDIARTDYEDNRDSTQKGFAMRYPRLPIGHFLLKPVGEIQSTSSMRLDLYNAETVADIITNKGTIHFKAYIHRDKMLLIIETTTTGEEKNFKIEFKPDLAISPRQLYVTEKKQATKLAPEYRNNPSPTFSTINAIDYCEQKLLFGGQLTTAWKEIKDKTKRTILINSTPTYPENNSTDLAVEILKYTRHSDLTKLNRTHRKWWNAYYPISFVSLPDARLESFYWIQMYKLASATRANRPYIDNQ